MTQNHTGKYMKWSSAYAKYLCKTTGFRGINSKLLNCCISHCEKVNKKLGNEETENSEHTHLPSCYQHGGVAGCSLLTLCSQLGDKEKYQRILSPVF